MSSKNSQPGQLILEQCLAENKQLSAKIWRGKSPNQNTRLRNQLKTGYEKLDKVMGGWQLGVTTEIGLQSHGIGELRLLFPAIKALQNRKTGPTNIVFINPPLIPYAPALLKYGINLQKLTLIQPKTLVDTLWSCEQVLLSGACAATICWTSSNKLGNTQLRRLQLAAEKHQSFHVLFREQAQLHRPSVSNVRIKLSSDRFSRLKVNVSKQVGKWSNQSCLLSLQPHYEKWQIQTVELWPLPEWQKCRLEKAEPQLELVSNIKSNSLYLFPSQRILVAV